MSVESLGKNGDNINDTEGGKFCNIDNEELPEHESKDEIKAVGVPHSSETDESDEEIPQECNGKENKLEDENDEIDEPENIQQGMSTNDDGSDVVEDDQTDSEIENADVTKQINHEENEEASSNEQGAENEEDGEATAVPRRTRFWDHDDRFADIVIEESRESQRSKKLWDKSEVNRWTHDKFIEAEQGPKDKWEIERNLQDLEGRDSRRRGGDDSRANRRQLADFIPLKNGSRWREPQNPGRMPRGVRRNDEGSTRNVEKRFDKNNMNQNGDQPSKNHSGDKRETQEKSLYEPRSTNQNSPIHYENLPVREKIQPRRSFRDEYPEIVGQTKEDDDRNIKGVRESNRKQGRGRSRRIADKNSRRQPVALNGRGKRIEQLPPRLREKAREKMKQQEKNYEQEEGNQYDDANNEEQQSPDESVPRDKPKRYSTQRQKTGTSMIDIPSQIPETVDPNAYYQQLAYINQAIQAAHLAAMQQQSHNKEVVQSANIHMLEQQILQVQSQLQQHFNLRPTAPMPNMVPEQTRLPMYNTDSMYAMNQPLLTNTTGGAEDMLANPQMNPLMLNQIISAAHQASFFPSPLQAINDGDSRRRTRPAAIPIKPPPGLEYQ